MVYADNRGGSCGWSTSICTTNPQARRRVGPGQRYYQSAELILDFIISTAPNPAPNPNHTPIPNRNHNLT